MLMVMMKEWETIADELGVDLEVKNISCDDLIPALESGQIDVIVAGISPTDERREQINFTDAYYESATEQTVIVRSDSDYANATSLEDLTGDNLSAQQGTYQMDLLEQVELSDMTSDPLQIMPHYYKRPKRELLMVILLKVMSLIHKYKQMMI